MPTPSLPLATLLAHAADAVAAVRGGRSLTEALTAVPAAARPGSQALAFEALRRLGSAQVLLGQLVAKAPPRWTEALLLTALALAWDGGAAEQAPPYAPHTLVSQAVEAAKRRARAQAGLVNAVLRRFLRERASLVVTALRDPVAEWNHPRWWIERLQQDWPQHWPSLLHAANARAPMTLRVNRRRGSAPAYLERLTAAGIAARAVAEPGLAADAIELLMPCPVQALPGFSEGAVSVQDLAAQQAAPLLLGGSGGGVPLPPGARVLDACSAPGGKTAQLLELADLDLLALDADAKRLVKVQETLARLGLEAQLRAADAAAPATWWDGKPFDAILLDAPCTASGIVRRHPDVRWLRRPSDIDALAQAQARLLASLWPLLKPGGRLLYATCSLFRAEGEGQVDAFLQRAPDARLRPSPGRLLGVPDNPAQGAREVPAPGTDGFFYALLDKCPS